MVLGIAAPGLRGRHWHQAPIPAVTRDLWDPLPSSQSSVLTCRVGTKTRAHPPGISLKQSWWGWLVGGIEFCCITVLEKLLLVGKLSEPINWYLSVSHVCGGVNESQQ